MGATFHESEERLELYALKRISDSDAIRIEEHLLVCDFCRDRLDETANFAIAMRGAIKSNLVAPVPRFDFSRFFPLLRPHFAMGALAIAVLAVILVWNGRSRLAPVASLQLSAMRGNAGASVPPSREIDLTLTDTVPGSGAVVEVVDGRGAEVWQGLPEMSGGVARAKVLKTLPAGEYWVRFFDSPGHMLHEYSFRVEQR